MQGKIAVVLGGSSGIGAATARLLAKRGAHVTIAAPVPEAEMNALVTDIRRSGGLADACSCDVTDAASVQALFDTVGQRHSRLDIVVNSAGVFTTTPVFEPDLAAAARLVSINLMGGFHVAFAAIKAMRRTGGVLVMVTSTQAVLAEPMCSVYAATKAGIAHFMAAITPELKNTGIRGICVAPGGTRTPMAAHIADGATPDSRAFLKMLDEKHGGAYGQFFLEAEQVAEVIAFAASDAARPLQGVSLTADQGYTAAMPGFFDALLT